MLAALPLTSTLALLCCGPAPLNLTSNPMVMHAHTRCTRMWNACRWLAAPGLRPLARLELTLSSKGGVPSAGIPVYTGGSHVRELTLPTGLQCSLTISCCQVGTMSGACIRVI